MSLFDNICRKFESMRHDVDEVVNHDSIKYIERKLYNVRENVMNFYGKVAEVIVTPIMDLENDEDEEINQQQDADAIISDFKLLKDNDVDYTTDTQSTNESTDSSTDDSTETESTDDSTETESTDDSTYTESNDDSTDTESTDESTDTESTDESTDTESTDESTDTESTDESVDSDESALGTSASESFSITSSTLSFSSASSTLDASSSASMSVPSDVAALYASSSASSDGASSAISNHETIAKMGSNSLPKEAFTTYSNALTSSSSGIALQNNAIPIIKWHSAYLCSQVDSYENWSSNIASSMESNIASSVESSGSSSDYHNCETTDLDEEAKDLSHQVELEKTCVIVDYITPHDDVPCEAQKQPSYKEKILDALSSKNRLARKFKELVNLHRDNTTKCFQGTSLPSPPKVLLRDSQTVHLSGSDWVLL